MAAITLSFLIVFKCGEGVDNKFWIFWGDTWFQNVPIFLPTFANPLLSFLIHLPSKEGMWDRVWYILKTYKRIKIISYQSINRVHFSFRCLFVSCVVSCVSALFVVCVSALFVVSARNSF